MDLNDDYKQLASDDDDRSSENENITSAQNMSDMFTS